MYLTGTPPPPPFSLGRLYNICETRCNMLEHKDRTPILWTQQLSALTDSCSARQHPTRSWTKGPKCDEKELFETNKHLFTKVYHTSWWIITNVVQAAPSWHEPFAILGDVPLSPPTATQQPVRSTVASAPRPVSAADFERKAPSKGETRSWWLVGVNEVLAPWVSWQLANKWLLIIWA